MNINRLNKVNTIIFVISIVIFNLSISMEKEESKEKEIEQNISNILNPLSLSGMPEEIKYEILNKLVNSIIEKNQNLPSLEVIELVAKNILPLKGIDREFDRIINHYIRTDLNGVLKSYGIDINQSNKENTFLAIAALQGNNNLVKLLIDAGANVNAQNNGLPALILSTTADYKDTVKLLIDSGANVDAQNKRGNISLTLLKPDRRSTILSIDNGDTALILATRKNHKDIVELLIKYNANVNAQNNYGNTALLEAVLYDYPHLITLLIGAGAKVNQKYWYGDTLLIRVVKSGHINLVKLLIDAGANINIQDRNGNTALITAIYTSELYNDSYNMVKLLIDNGIDIDIRNDFGENALDVAKNEALRNPSNYSLNSIIELLKKTESQKALNK